MEETSASINGLEQMDVLMNKYIPYNHEMKSTARNKVSSEQLYEDAKEFLPGGVTANIKYFSPFPLFMQKGYGNKIIDADENEYVDYNLGYGALMTGHGHPSVVKSVVTQIYESGSLMFGTPHELEVKMAQKLNLFYPSMEQMRFTNSGTEANLLALRLAVAYTNKQKVAKFEGHYHGGLNSLLFSINPDESKVGSETEPNAVIESDGIPESEEENTIILPFNNLEASVKLLEKHQNELAAVIIEPVQGGAILPEASFLKGLREITEKLNILLIFDEVKTGFRVALGGAQEYYDISPDITTLGKVIGGGLPIGVVGGKKEIMMRSAADKNADVFSVGSVSDQTKNIVFHSGTYNGHPLVLTAGLETLRLLEEGDLLQLVFSHTKHLRKRLELLYKKYNINMKTIGLGSIFNIIITDEPIRNYRDIWKADLDLRKKIDTELLNYGIYCKPLNRYSMSTVHTIEDTERTIKAHEAVLQKILNNS